MRKAFIPCLVLYAMSAACSQNNSNTNVNLQPQTPASNSNSGSDSAQYFIKANVNSAPWECRGLDANVTVKHIGIGTDTLITYTGQAYSAGAFTRLNIRLLNFHDTGYVAYPNLSLEVSEITSDPDYNSTHIYNTKSGNLNTTWAFIERDNDTIVEGVFSGMVYTDNMQDSLELSWGRFKLKW